MYLLQFILNCILQFSEKLKVTNVIFNFNEAVKSLEGDLATMVPTYKELIQQIDQQLISPFSLIENNNKETQTSKSTFSNESDDFKSRSPRFQQVHNPDRE